MRRLIRGDLCLRQQKHSHKQKDDTMNNKAQFTPGPWLINKVQNEPEKITIIDADMCFVAEVWQTYVNGESRQQENAHLIAAAPAMYEALRSIPDHALDCKHSYPHTLACWNCIVKAALAQAEAKS